MPGKTKQTGRGFEVSFLRTLKASDAQAYRWVGIVAWKAVPDLFSNILLARSSRCTGSMPNARANFPRGLSCAWQISESPLGFGP